MGPRKPVSAGAFDTLLVANRGEIACRILRTARGLGLRTVAVYSEADANARHVGEADLALPIGPAAAGLSYLNAERIVQAALDSGAQAIHPGYGFLSEKLALIDACTAAGLVFVGPHRAAVAAMGDKIAAKQLARDAGVPGVPGFDSPHADDQHPAVLRDAARRLGFPVLIKASAGGGGKGMRRVDREADFDSALALARQEAVAAFGDDRVLIERCITRPRHLEVQLMGDRHGGLVHLFERECSVQRRFQKVVEEAPAAHLSAATAQRLYESALRLGRAMRYDNAGTVEFVLDADQPQQPWFLEVNTRLQVEHPVTEMTTGIDIVEWQLRVAAGERLPLAQDDIERRGWALECRVNAEQAAHGFRPSFGPLTGYGEGPALPGLRIDSGLHGQSVLTPDYDSLLAKVIGFGADRDQAMVRAQAGLAGLRIEGVHTTQGLLHDLLGHPGFQNELDTGLLARLLDQGLAQPTAARTAQHRLALAAAVLTGAAPPPCGPWQALTGFRLDRHEPARTWLSLKDLDGDAGEAGAALDAFELWPSATGVWVGQGQHRAQAQARPNGDGGWTVSVVDGERQASVWVRPLPGQPGAWSTWSGGHSHHWRLRTPTQALLDTPGAKAALGTHASEGDWVVAPLPGRVSALAVHLGDPVAAGDPLVTLEAMKLYHALLAPHAGTVTALRVTVGQVVGHRQPLVSVRPHPG